MGISKNSSGNQGRYNRIDIEPGLWALAIEILSTTDTKVAVEVEDGMQVYQLLNSSKHFDLLSSNRKSQVADSPVYEPSRCISLMCAALWPQKSLRSSLTNEF